MLPLSQNIKLRNLAHTLASFEREIYFEICIRKIPVQTEYQNVTCGSPKVVRNLIGGIDKWIHKYKKKNHNELIIKNS